MGGLWGSISLLQITNLALSGMALGPPQLPFMFLPISITPSDMIVTITIKIMNVIKKISIMQFSYINFYEHSINL